MSQRKTYEVNLESDGLIMTHHSNGAADSGPPSLFGEIAAADTPRNSISILSAVTGKEVPRSSMRKNKSPLKAAMLFLLLLITGVLGFNFWSSNENAFAPKLAISQSKPSTTPSAKLVPTTPSPILGSSPVPTKTATSSDVAVVETVQPAPTLASIAPLTQPAQQKKPASTKKPSDSTVRPRKVQAKQTTTIANAPIKKSAQQKTVQTSKASSIVKTASARGPDAKDVPSQPKKVAVGKVEANPDEKLLEGMLRLMKRENAKDAANISSAK